MAYRFNPERYNGLEIAIIGMACRFPGAKNLSGLWNLLIENKESISFFAPDEIEDPLFPKEITGSSAYVRARGILEDIEYFDANLFGYNPNEARLLDPQIRLFHECAWESLEDAGYTPRNYEGSIGVYAGAHNNAFWEINGLLAHNDRDYSNKDFIASRLSYKLNLKGPSQAVYTACSTSLVAVHMACRSLLNGECNMAIAGGSSIEMPQRRGYLYSEEGILSSSGHNRTFDAGADGTVFSNGVGVVVLKLLEDAIKDKDNIHAVIRGSAINNDGDRKVSFTAPSVQGQVEVIKDALAFSGVDAGDICYVETHGSATSLGDRIELEALKQVFASLKGHRCGLGSIKSNIGHTNAAAGIAGLLKVILSLKQRIIPASLHYKFPHPGIHGANSPFYVVAQNEHLDNTGDPLIMGVTSLGVGGTNAHVIVEEPPCWEEEPQDRPYSLLTFSAKTEWSLTSQAGDFDRFFSNHSLPGLPGIAYTLNAGRTVFPRKGMLVCSTAGDLRDGKFLAGLTQNDPDNSRRLIFYFPDSGYYYRGLGTALYRQETGFREELDNCFEDIRANTGHDLAPFFTNDTSDHHNEITTLLAFSVQYAMARYLMELDIKPDLMVGQGTGEWVIACLSGTLSPARAFQSLTAPESLSGLQDTISPGSGMEKDLVVSIGSGPGNWDPIFPGPGKPCDENLHFTRQIGHLWLSGKGVNWTAYYRHAHSRKVSLPTYAFDRKEYTLPAIDIPAIRRLIDQPSGAMTTPGHAAARSGSAKDWLYYPVWKQSILSWDRDQLLNRQGCWLIFGYPGNALAAELSAQLREAGQKPVLVFPGDEFELSEQGCHIDISNREDYVKLLNGLKDKEFIPDHIIHLWNLSSFTGAPAERAVLAQQYGYYSLVFLAQALGKLTEINRVRITLVTSNLQNVTGLETIETEKSTLLGPLSVIPHENLQLSLKSLDLETAFREPLSLAAGNIIGETMTESREKMVACRNGKRWVHDYEQYKPGNTDLSRIPLFKDGGRYLILGGLGNIGIHVADYISRKVKATFILTNRSGALGGNDPGNPETARKKSLLQGMEERGSTVRIKKADLADRDGMTQLWEELLNAYGKIDGVIHSAGIINALSNMCPIETIDQVLSEEQFGSKVYGLYVLDGLFRQFGGPDCCILMSSLATVLGGIGFTAYSAANIFMDYFAKSKFNQTGTKWLSMNWDAWEFDYAAYIKEAHDYQMAYAMHTDEALEAFHLGLTLPYSDQVVISTGDMHARMARYLELLDQPVGDGNSFMPAPGETDPEKIMVALWKKHLGHSEIKLTDDFFKLGGNSFLLVALLNDLKLTFGKRVTIKEFYKNPRIPALLKLLQSRDQSAIKPLQSAEKKEYYELTEGQKGIYFHTTLEPGGTHYNELKIFEIEDKADIARLETACRELIQRHESLRTCFRMVKGRPVQVIHAGTGFKIDVFNGVSGDIVKIAENYSRPFDLSNFPLFRMAVIRTESGKTCLISDFHHIIYDAISMNIMKNDLLALYNGLELAPVKFQYKDVSEKVNGRGYQNDLAVQRNYWTKALAGLSSSSEIPFDMPGPDKGTEEAFEDITIPEQDYEEIKRFVREADVSLFTFLISVLSILVEKYILTGDITIGVAVSGRTDPDHEEIVGMFVNMLPFRSFPGEDKKFIEFLQETHKANLELLNAQRYPYNLLVRDMRNDLKINFPLFSVVFNMLSEIMTDDKHQDLPFVIFKKDIPFTRNRVTKYPFIFNVTEYRNTLHIGINYSPGRHQKDTIKSFLQGYLVIMQSVIQDRDILLKGIQMEALSRDLILNNL